MDGGKIMYTSRVMNTVLNTVKEYAMFEKGDRVVLGLSGGADSVVLLDVLSNLKGYDLEVVVAHVNHQIREGTAERDASFAKELALKYGKEYNLLVVDIPTMAKNSNIGEEEAGRIARYGFFNDLCNGGKVATAHNANDNVETLLMRVMRGTSLMGLAGIPYTRDNIVRPLLGVSREDIEGYIVENNLVHITDETNAKEIYTRNKVRLSLIPHMKEFNGNLINTVTNSINSFAEENSYIESQVDSIYSSVVKGNVLSIDNIEHSVIKKRIIMRMLKSIRGTEQVDVSAVVLDSIVSLGEKSEGSRISLAGGVEAVRRGGTVVFECKGEEEVIEVKELTEGVVEVCGVALEVGEILEYNDIVNTEKTLYIPAELFESRNFVLRMVQNGDKYRKDDEQVKNTNRVLSDLKVARGLRNSVMVVADKEIVYMMCGYSATRYKKRSGLFRKVCVLDRK